MTKVAVQTKNTALIVELVCQIYDLLWSLLTTARKGSVNLEVLATLMLCIGNESRSETLKAILRTNQLDHKSGSSKPIR